ncbi:VP9a [Lishui pangolin virus]|nr:VP9a [Lishui pangolin virus]
MFGLLSEIVPTNDDFISESLNTSARQDHEFRNYVKQDWFLGRSIRMEFGASVRVIYVNQHSNATRASFTRGLGRSSVVAFVGPDSGEEEVRRDDGTSDWGVDELAPFSQLQRRWSALCDDKENCVLLLGTWYYTLGVAENVKVSPTMLQDWIVGTVKGVVLSVVDCKWDAERVRPRGRYYYLPFEHARSARCLCLTKTGEDFDFCPRTMFNPRGCIYARTARLRTRIVSSLTMDEIAFRMLQMAVPVEEREPCDFANMVWAGDVRRETGIEEPTFYIRPIGDSLFEPRHFTGFCTFGAFRSMSYYAPTEDGVKQYCLNECRVRWDRVVGESRVTRQ